jgi:hypothetical protein
MIEPEKPKKTVYPIQTGGAFKIHERKKSLAVEKKKVEVPSRVARALKLADE